VKYVYVDDDDDDDVTVSAMIEFTDFMLTLHRILFKCIQLLYSQTRKPLNLIFLDKCVFGDFYAV